jgi:hypothetical protein
VDQARRATFALVILGAFVLSPAAAQHSEDPDSQPRPHGTTFSQGPRTDWTFAPPHLDIDGGWFSRKTSPEVSEAFFRVHFQTAPGIKYLEISSDLLWLPALGATPTWSVVLQVAPISEESRFYLSAGFGGITGRDPSGDRLAAWVQAVAAVRTPIHELTPFVQFGRPLVSGARPELLVGIAHPLAPYLLHLP